MPYVDKVKSVKKHGGFPTEVSDMARNMKMELLTFSLYCTYISLETVDIEYTYYSWCMTSTDIVKWRKTKDYENFEKGMIYMNILKNKGVVEEETKSMPHAPVVIPSENHYSLKTRNTEFRVQKLK